MLKSWINNGIQVTLNFSSNAVGKINDETNNFLHKLLSINTQVSRIWKALANGSSASIKFSKTQLSKMLQLGGFLRRFPGPLLKTGLPLKEHLFKPLAKNVWYLQD